ncbi:MAG TPA: heavy-metal-associated domain-containing protein [Geobacteraceae bacterium]|nr:heavy-metal-associated domain-containing protein [Geobacteraceae bacterium]
MNKKNAVNVILIIIAVTMLVLLAFRVRTGATADAVAVLRTAGMTCGSCSDRITKALAREKGVAVTEVDLAGGWVVVGYDTKSVKPEVLEAKIIGAGFDSKLRTVLTPAEFKQITGREIGKSASSAGGCGGCGSGGGCGTKKQG